MQKAGGLALLQVLRSVGRSSCSRGCAVDVEHAAVSLLAVSQRLDQSAPFCSYSSTQWAGLGMNSSLSSADSGGQSLLRVSATSHHHTLDSGLLARDYSSKRLQHHKLREKRRLESRRGSRRSQSAAAGSDELTRNSPEEGQDAVVAEASVASARQVIKPFGM